MASNKKPFEAVVISGGGVKGILALGILHYYYENNLYIPEVVTEYSGTSIGSAIGLLLAVGYLPLEIFREIYSMDNFFTMKDCNSGWDIFKHMGLMSIESMIGFIGELVEKKLGIIPTLGKLKELTGKRLCTSGANLTKNREEMYTPETHPNLGSLKAVMMSCNLPLVFQRVSYHNSFIVDGGLVNNFPWEYISEGLNTLGIIISVVGDSPFPDNEFIGYVYRAMMITSTTLSDLKCQMAPNNVHIVKTGWEGGSFLQFTMSRDAKMDMFLSGYKSAEQEEKKEYITVKNWNL